MADDDLVIVDEDVLDETTHDTAALKVALPDGRFAGRLPRPPAGRSRRGGRAIPAIGAGLAVPTLRYKRSYWRNPLVPLSKRRLELADSTTDNAILLGTAEAGC